MLYTCDITEDVIIKGKYYNTINSVLHSLLVTGTSLGKETKVFGKGERVWLEENLRGRRHIVYFEEIYCSVCCWSDDKSLLTKINK